MLFQRRHRVNMTSVWRTYQRSIVSDHRPTNMTTMWTHTTRTCRINTHHAGPCTYRYFHFPKQMENENNGMYTDPRSSVSSSLILYLRVRHHTATTSKHFKQCGSVYWLFIVIAIDALPSVKPLYSFYFDNLLLLGRIAVQRTQTRPTVTDRV